MNNFEVLAPAGSVESFYAAINNGADAVYLGLQDFNARDKADNFTTENLREYVKYAHMFSVKVYLTVNTVVVDSEFEKLKKMIEVAVESKVDAYIVQDFGVAKMLKDNFKNIVLHASTQMGIHNLYGAKVAEKLGFTRIVLSRETTLKDIKDIVANTNLEIEYFVQGANCVAFSGSCYMSSLCNNESGNRGRCLQLCRLNYLAKLGNKDLGNGYFLSPVDNCLLHNLKELKEAGVISLKIEGRMRRPGYVAVATKTYRDAVDNMLLNKNFESAEKNLRKVFYRGEYNKGFYLTGERKRELINKEFQNHRGEKIGKVIKVSPFKDIYEIIILTNGEKLSKNDGLKFVLDGVEQSMGVGNFVEMGDNKFKLYSKTKPSKDANVYRILDFATEEEFLNNKRKLKINFEFIGRVDKKAKLKACFGSICVEVESENILESAKTSPVGEKDIRDSLSKLNDTIFEFDELEVDIDKIFIAKSQLNDLRRKVVEKLTEEILSSYENKLPKVEKIKETRKENFVKESLDYVVVDEFTNYIGNVQNIIFAPQNFTAQTINNLKKEYQNKTCFLNLPTVLNYDDFYMVDEIVKTSNLNLVANNIYGLNYLNYGYRVICGYTMNVANSYTKDLLLNLGVCDFVSSIENFASDFKYGLSYQGKPMVMTFCHCPYKTVRGNDECKNCKFDNSLVYKNGEKEFKIRRNKIKNCYFELVFPYEIKTEKMGGKFIDLRK